MKIKRRNPDNTVNVFSLDEEDAIRLILFSFSIIDVFRKAHPEEYGVLMDTVIKETAQYDRNLKRTYKLYTDIFSS